LHINCTLFAHKGTKVVEGIFKIFLNNLAVSWHLPGDYLAIKTSKEKQVEMAHKWFTNDSKEQKEG